MARGGRSAFLGLMAAFGLFLVAMLALRIALSVLLPAGTGDSGRGPLRNALLTFVQIFDPGSMEADIDSSGWLVFTAILAGLGGVFIVSILIAFLTTALDTRLSKLRRGHSQVIESGHTLILGWEEQRIAEIVRQLVIANESERGKAIVILAERDKAGMDDFLALQVPDTRTSRLVTRSGNPASVINLRLVSAATASSAIILAGCSDASPSQRKAESDARVVKTLLALESEQPTTHSVNVVVELFGKESRAMCESIGIEPISSLDTTRLLARVLAQTSRSVGLSVVYDEIMSFAGSELYFTQHEWGGATFGEIAYRFGDSVPVGVVHPGGGLALNPDPDTSLTPQHRVLVLAEDDSTIRFTSDESREQALPSTLQGRREQQPERQLVIGWGPKAELLLIEYASYVAPGSPVDIMPRTTTHDVSVSTAVAVNILDRNPLDPETWAMTNLLDYDHVILLSEGHDGATPDAIDAETIMILLMLRAAIDREDPEQRGRRPTVVTELLDSANQVIASKAGVYDFVVSNRIVSLLFAQISQQPGLHDVYETLLSAGSSEIYLKPITLYVAELPATRTFEQLRALAMNRDEICIGIKTKSGESDVGQNYGVRLLPVTSARIDLLEGDTLIVVAEDEL